MKPSTELTRFIQGVKVVPPEPQEFLVQRQLKSWLEPGWCMTEPAGSEAKAFRRAKHISWRVAVMLVLLWLLALVTSYLIGGLNLVLLVVAIVMVLLAAIQGRQPWLIKGVQARARTRSGAVADLADWDDLSRFEGEGGAQAPEPARAGGEPFQSFAAAIGDAIRQRPICAAHQTNRQ